MIKHPLIQSRESEYKMNLIFKLARFSDDMKAALTNHFVNGYPKSTAATVSDVRLPNLEKQITRCNELNNIANLISES